jgi:hypothetical protein
MPAETWRRRDVSVDAMKSACLVTRCRPDDAEGDNAANFDCGLGLGKIEGEL